MPSSLSGEARDLSIPPLGRPVRLTPLFKGHAPNVPRAWSARPLPDDAIARGENLCSPYSDSLRPSHRLRRGAGAAGAQPPCDLGLCLAHRPQKRRARCLVRRNLPMTNDYVYPTGCAVHRVLGLSPYRRSVARRDEFVPAGRRVGTRSAPGAFASLAVGWRALGDRTQRGRPFAKPSPPGDSGDVAACQRSSVHRERPHEPLPKWAPVALLAFHGGPWSSRSAGGAGLY